MLKRTLFTLTLMASSGASQANLVDGSNANEYLSALYAGTPANAAQDPNAIWTMGYISTASGYRHDPSIELHTRYNHVGSGALIGFGHEMYNGFGLNNTGGDVNLFEGTIGTDELYGHHGNRDTQGLYLRFTAQSNATYRFDIAVTAIDKANRGEINASVYYEGGQVARHIIDADGVNYPSSLVYQDDVAMQAGEHLDIYTNLFGDEYFNDSYKVNANARQINNVNSPFALGAFALGLLGLGARQRRQR